MEADIRIRGMEEVDIDRLARAFADWGKTEDKYRAYYEQQRQDSRVVLVADIKGTVVGYATVVWRSGYEWFNVEHIPEIVDLNVMIGLQKRGIGTRLILAAEDWARNRSKARIGISVEQSAEHAAAQRLYLALGYVPDGRGLTPHDNELHLVKVLAQWRTSRDRSICSERSDGAETAL